MKYKYGNGSRSDELIKMMIPIMVLWAKYSWNEFHTYSDLQKAINAKSPRLGYQLGLIDDIFSELSQEYQRKIPTLNALIVNATTGLPSNGFDYVDSHYSMLSKEEKSIYAKGKNEEAHAYDYTWVLDVLGLEFPTYLKHSLIDNARNNASFHQGGEGKAHSELKEYVSSNPEIININGCINSFKEYNLVSGDRVDVMIQTQEAMWAIEVKSHISNEQDILRGIYQCVKYKAILEAEMIIHKNSASIKTLLILEDRMPDELRKVAEFLNVQFLDKFTVKKD